jgi:hypothetical protein
LHFDVYVIDEEVREVLTQLGNGRELTAALHQLRRTRAYLKF